jgi:hypothetical protein
MANITSILPKPKIKCYVRDNMICEIQLDDTAVETLEKVKELTEKERLWTGESTYCICTHHVRQHCTIRDRYGYKITIHCHGSDECCNCEGFRTFSIRLSHSNCYRMVTEC